MFYRQNVFLEIAVPTTKRQQQQHPLFKDDAGKSEDALVEECFYKKTN